MTWMQDQVPSATSQVAADIVCWMTTRPDPNADWWYTEDVAAYIKIKPNTLSGYLSRNQVQLPEPTMFNRTPAWRPQQIIDWHTSRPGRGKRRTTD